ncbi:hypothetical protein [Desulfosediminicola ganghwensis]|uniref:hypothetical protein n=1 Tax=Desulfosediminicola ganghwensis TaxID=2569540 RepID=UPI0010ABBB2D|nr:hypothetical protein [Desulfosediminicola ganghwensis]
MKKVLIIIPTLLLLSGCASMSPIEKANESESHFKNVVYKGQDFYQNEDSIPGEKYRIFHQASTGFSGTSGIRRAATARANEFCQNIDSTKKMLTISEHTAKPPYVMGNFPRIEIIFACVDKNHSNTISNYYKNDKYDDLKKLK